MSLENEVHNAALGPYAASLAHDRACREFLESTVGLKLAPGPLNMLGRAAWTKVLMALEAVGDYEAETRSAQVILDRERRDE